tara:strand:- start:789 stop:1412 length:624 start_codon:yes stop_codon:yes gene_type:complete
MPDDDTLLTANTDDVEDVQQAENSPEATNDTTTDAKASDAATTEEGQTNEEEVTEEASAPEEYSVFDLPEDFSFNEETLSDYHTFAKENKLTQEQAQRGVNMVAKMKEAEMAQWVEQQKSWVDDAKSDAEYGGEKFDENISIAVKARDSFGTPEFNEMLDSSGLGNHPEMIRFLNRVGKAISEDSVVVGGANTTEKTREAVLYPSMQ